MKIIVTAIAFAFASTAAAQSAPAMQHQGHQMPMPQTPAPGQPAPPPRHQPSQPQGNNMAGDCCGDRNGNGIRDCCEGMPQGRPTPAGQPLQAQPQNHSNH